MFISETYMIVWSYLCARAVLISITTSTSNIRTSLRQGSNPAALLVTSDNIQTTITC